MRGRAHAMEDFECVVYFVYAMNIETNLQRSAEVIVAIDCFSALNRTIEKWRSNIRGPSIDPDPVHRQRSHKPSSCKCFCTPNTFPTPSPDHPQTTISSAWASAPAVALVFPT